MSQYNRNSAKGRSHQHNGNIYGSVTNNITYNQTRGSSESEAEQALILLPQRNTARPLDARFDGDDQAIALWVKENDLRVSRFKRAVDDRSIIDRMSSYSVYRTYQHLASRRLAGTTQWISQSPEFKVWVESTISAELFLVGNVGSGKTTLMTTMVQDALKSSYPKSPVLTFFFEQSWRSVIDLFASLTQQLLRHMIAARRPLSAKLRVATRELYNKELTKPTLEEIQRELFEPILQEFPGCVIVIDGIDNTDSSRVYPTALYFHELRDRLLFKLLLSTRDELDLPPDAPKIHLASTLGGNLLNNLDIRKYVDAKLAGLTRPDKLLADDSLRSLVRKELLRSANGMFLWVVLQIEYLFGRDGNDDGTCQTAEDVRRNIGQMPKSLNGIYEQCLRRQTGLQARYTARILRWVCASPETTHIDNIRELLAFDPTTKQLAQDAVPRRKIVLRAATNLVVLESLDQCTGQETISRSHLVPIHSTVRDFIFSSVGQNALREVTGDARYWTQADTVLELGGICAAYLLAFSGQELAAGHQSITSHVPSTSMINRVYDTTLSAGSSWMVKKATSLWVGAPEERSTTMRRPKQIAEEVEVRLLEFARNNWHICLRYANKGTSAYNDFKALVFEHAGTLHRPWARDKKATKRSQVESLLFWALSNDHVALFDLAIEESTREKLFSATFWTEPLAASVGVPLLHFAVRRCHEAIVTRMLPYCSANGSYNRCTALHCAVESAGLDVVLLLLRYVEGVTWPYRNVRSKDTNGRTVIHLAAIRDSVDIFQALCAECGPLLSIEHEEKDLLDQAKCTPLYYALLRDNLGIISTILDVQIIAEQDLSVVGGSLTKVKDVASRNIIAYVLQRVAEHHEFRKVIQICDLDTLAESIGLPDEARLEIMAVGIATGDLDDKTFEAICSWCSLHTHYQSYQTWSQIVYQANPSRILALHDKLRARGVISALSIKSKAGLNLADWAVRRGDHAMMSILVLTDTSYLTTLIGEHGDQVMPIQMAARRSFLEVVKVCSQYSTLEAHWNAMVEAALVHGAAADHAARTFQWLLPVWRELGRFIFKSCSTRSRLEAPDHVALEVIAHSCKGCLIVPFVEEASVFDASIASTHKAPSFALQYVTLPADAKILVTLKFKKTAMRLYLVQPRRLYKPMPRLVEENIHVVGGGHSSTRSYYEFGNQWTVEKAETNKLNDPQWEIQAWVLRLGRQHDS